MDLCACRKGEREQLNNTFKKLPSLHVHLLPWLQTYCVLGSLGALGMGTLLTMTEVFRGIISLSLS